VVGEGGVADGAEHLVLVGRPGDEGDPVDRLDRGQVPQGTDQLLEPPRRREAEVGVDAVVGLHPLVGLDPHVAGQVMVPTAQPLLRPGHAPAEEGVTDTLPTRDRIDVAEEVGPLEEVHGGRVPHPRPADEPAVDVRGASVEVEVEVGRRDRLLELLHRDHSR
jgi:hypothetical protein